MSRPLQAAMHRLVEAAADRAGVPALDADARAAPLRFAADAGQ